MKRRSRAGGEPIKGRRRKAAQPTRRDTPKAPARSNSFSTGEQTEVARLTRELKEALEQQTATSEVLQVISSSPEDLQRVFDTMLAKAVRLCEASFGILWLAEGDRFRSLALHNLPPALAAARRREPVVQFGPQSGIGRVVERRRAFQIDDLTIDPGYIERDSRIIALVELGRARTAVFAPLLKDSQVIGSLVLYRQEVRSFSERQVELLTGFAAEAVIAIENARLLSELRQRTDDLTERTADLTEALEQQTATSEVLQVISSSPGDLQPVFATMLEKAVRICDAKWGNIHRWDGDALHLLATHNTPPAFAEARGRSPNYPGSDTAFFGRMVATKTVAHVADAAAEQPYIERSNPAFVAAVELGGARTALAVPMLKESELIGTLALARQEVRPFTDKQIALVTSFAAQAVIAIENAASNCRRHRRGRRDLDVAHGAGVRVTPRFPQWPFFEMSNIEHYSPDEVQNVCRAGGRSMSTKVPDPVDRYVGSRVRLRRRMLRMSQQNLGHKLTGRIRAEARPTMPRTAKPDQPDRQDYVQVGTIRARNAQISLRRKNIRRI